MGAPDCTSGMSMFKRNGRQRTTAETLTMAINRARPGTPCAMISRTHQRLTKQDGTRKTSQGHRSRSASGHWVQNQFPDDQNATAPKHAMKAASRMKPINVRYGMSSAFNLKTKSSDMGSNPYMAVGMAKARYAVSSTQRNSNQWPVTWSTGRAKLHTSSRSIHKAQFPGGNRPPKTQ